MKVMKLTGSYILVWYASWLASSIYTIIPYYTITWLLCAFSLVVDRDLLKDTHTGGVKSTSDHVSRLVFLFSCPKNSSINHLNFYCIKQIDYIFPCVIYHLLQYTCTERRNLFVKQHTGGSCCLLFLGWSWSIRIEKATLLQYLSKLYSF